MMNGAILTFRAFHGRKPHEIGSSRIRGDWVMKHWPAELGQVENFVQGKPYDFVIYQKVYWAEHAEKYQGIKILDMCDADWYDYQYEITDMIRHMDAITTSTEALATELEKLVAGMVLHGDLKRAIPVRWIDDRVDMDFHKPKKTEHPDKIEWVGWFGYGHNLRVIDSAIPWLKRQGFKLVVISDKAHKVADKNLPWTQDRISADIAENCDIVLNPRLNFGKWQFKSDNKTTQAWALGVPVARTIEEFETLLTKQARETEAKKRLEEVIKDYNPRLSAIQYGQIILEAAESKQSEAV